MDTAYESDPMLRLLTDALRRGPGSPEWHRALAELKTAAVPQADEYQILLTARERLESGREYREVRAGPAFTKELFGRLDAQPERARPWSVGTLVRLLLLLTLVASLGYVVMLLAQGGPHDGQQLSGRLFVTQVRAWSFDRMPRDLKTVGPLPLEARGNGLRAAGRDTPGPTSAVVYSTEPLDLDRGTCVEMRIDYKPGTTSVALLLRPETDGLTSADAGEREVAVVCDAAGVRIGGTAAAAPARPLTPGSHLLRIKAAGDTAVAEVDGQTLWSGPHGLGRRAIVGVRLVRDGKAGDVAVQSLRVLAP